MSKRKEPAPIRRWVAERLPEDVETALNRLRRARDVRRVAVMPDVHLARDVCIGTVVATGELIYPAAVGGDIGCGMAAVAFDTGAELLGDAATARRVLDALGETAPIIRNREPVLCAWLERTRLRDPSLDAMKLRDGRVQLGTLGRGNHFIEFQADESDNRLWLMVHSGSRGMGQAIRDYYIQCAVGSSCGLAYLGAAAPAGRDYLHDAGWARGYAELNRRAMVQRFGQMMQSLFGVGLVWSTYLRCDHNHVRREYHMGQWLWVHRKGAIDATEGRPGITPGSMGTSSYHVIGQGCSESLRSSSHGAGRAMSREQAMRHITSDQLRRQMAGTWFDPVGSDRLRDEAPGAYKDIDIVMRAQKRLTRITRRLRPLLSYKG